MKINFAGLREIYKTHLEDTKPASRDSCPPPERLLRLIRSEISGAERANIMNHVVQCGYCLDEIKALLEITDKANAFVLDLQRLAEAAGRDKSETIGRWSRYFSWNYVSVASLIILLAAVAAYSVFHFSSKPGIRGGEASVVELVSPVNQAVPAAGLKFVWKNVPQAKHYLVEVFDQTLDLAWRSDFVVAAELSPPEDIIRGFRPDETYRWMVTAVVENGDSLKSKMKSFSLKR